MSLIIVEVTQCHATSFCLFISKSTSQQRKTKIKIEASCTTCIFQYASVGKRFEDKIYESNK